MPTAEDLESRNTKTPLFTGVNPFFQALKDEKSLMVSLRGPSAKHFWDGLERLDERLKE